MADEMRQYPPSERKLALLWREGITPASPTVVAAAVMLAAGVLIALTGAGAVRLAAGMLTNALRLAVEPQSCVATVKMMSLQAAIVIAVVGIATLAAALLAQALQQGPRPRTPAPDLADGHAGSRWPLRFSGALMVRAVLMTSLAAIGTAAAVRGGLTSAGGLLAVDDPCGALLEVAAESAWPLLAMLAGAAAIDLLVGRASWANTAWMTRRELEEEQRASEGARLNRERRGMRVRRRGRG